VREMQRPKGRSTLSRNRVYTGFRLNTPIGVCELSRCIGMAIGRVARRGVLPTYVGIHRDRFRPRLKVGGIRKLSPTTALFGCQLHARQSVGDVVGELEHLVEAGHEE
jgi:hypothetical protein